MGLKLKGFMGKYVSPEVVKRYSHYRGGDFLHGTSVHELCDYCGHWLFMDKQGVVYCGFCNRNHRPKVKL